MKLLFLSIVFFIAFFSANNLHAQSTYFSPKARKLSNDTIPALVRNNMLLSQKILEAEFARVNRTVVTYNMPVQPLDISKFPAMPVLDPTKKRNYIPDVIPNGIDTSGINRMSFPDRIPQKAVPIR